LRDRHSLYAFLGEGLLHVVELEWLDDCLDFLHGPSSPGAGRSRSLTKQSPYRVPEMGRLYRKVERPFAGSFQALTNRKAFSRGSTRVPAVNRLLRRAALPVRRAVRSFDSARVRLDRD